MNPVLRDAHATGATCRASAVCKPGSMRTATSTASQPDQNKCRPIWVSTRSNGRYLLGPCQWVVVIVCLGRRLVGRALLRAPNADLSAAWMELNSAKHHGLVKHDDLVPAKVFPSNHLY